MLIRKRSLKDFILGATAQLTAKVKHALHPLFNPGDPDPYADKVGEAVSMGIKKPFPAQADALRALMEGFRQKRCLGLVAEMGCGKTLMGILAAWAMSSLKGRPTRSLVLCPPHLISTWTQEMKEIFGDAVRVVDASGKNALTLLTQLRDASRYPDKPEYWVIGFNRAKTNFRWKTTWWDKRAADICSFDGVRKVSRYTIPVCERCGHELPAAIDLSLRNTCERCSNPLWGPRRVQTADDPDGETTFAPVLYIKRYLRRHFQLLIADEVHKMKGAGTIQGAMLGQLAEAIEKTLVLTGTLSGGKASDVYFLLHRAFALNYSKDERRDLLPSYDELLEFVRTYGSLEEVYKSVPADPATGRASRVTYSLKEKPGISPMLLKQFFLENCVFLRISDIADALPGYTEVLEFVGMDPELAAEYAAFQEDLKKAVKEALKQNDMKVLGQMLSSLLAWPDQPQREVEVTNRKGEVVARAPALDVATTEKDNRLVQCVLEARRAGRKSLVFVEYTGKWSAGEHVERMLADAGIRPLLLKPSVPTHKRLDWIRKRMDTGKYDCLICQPKLVETGLNLLQFPEVLFWQTGYSTYTLRQASRRSWRPGQRQDVVVRFFINRDTMQEQAMTLIASKLEASLVLEGELSDKGLVALSEIGDSMTVELARSLVGHLKLQSLEAQFAAYRKLDAHCPSATPSVQPTLDIPTVVPAAASRDPQHAPAVIAPPRQLGRVIGMFAGPAGGKLKGRIRKLHVEAVPRESGRVLLAAGTPIGQWKQDEIQYEIDGKMVCFVVVAETTLPGFEQFTVHAIAA